MTCPRFGRFNCFLIGLGSAVGPSWWLRYCIPAPRPILAAPIDLPHWMAMACCCIRSMRSFRSAAVASSYESIVLSRIHSLISVHIDHSFQFRRFSQFLISFLQRQDGFLFGLCENIRHIQIHWYIAKLGIRSHTKGIFSSSCSTTCGSTFFSYAVEYFSLTLLVRGRLDPSRWHRHHCWPQPQPSQLPSPLLLPYGPKLNLHVPISH